VSQLEFGLRVVMPATLMPLHGAVVSDDGLYRYILTRTWDRSLPALVFCMLNPSTADATVDDPTIRKCIGFAQRLGYGGIIVVNLFAYRATKPRELYAQLAAGVDIVGPDADTWIKHAFGIGHRKIVAGWGTSPGKHSAHGGPQLGFVDLRIGRIRALAQEMDATLHAIGINEKTKTPRHPLMTPYATPMTEWNP